MKYYDISPELSAEIAVFPGDQSFRQTISYDINRGDNITLSSIQTTLHVGSHVDAPLHYQKGGAYMMARPLDIFMGRAQVISITPTGETISVNDLEKHKIEASRVLIKTQSFPNPTHWKKDFVAFNAASMEYLASHGVKLIGIDTPSVDLSESKNLESHKVVAKHDMNILEGIVLSEVPDGIYTLMALPLKIKNADASPVRAILFAGDLGIK